MTVKFKPMLAGECDLAKLKFPVLASPKLDGVRALVIGGRVVSRQLKPIPNPQVQDMFSHLPEGTDGELIVGDPTLSDAYRMTVSAVMAEDGDVSDLWFHVFDNFKVTGGFATRLEHVQSWACTGYSNVTVVPHLVMDDLKMLEAYEELAVDAGFEGVMLRSVDGPYKQNRSTTKEGYLLKLKRFLDGEALVMDSYEQMQNTNEAKVDLLGHIERSSHKAGLVGKGVLGGLDVVGLGGVYNDVHFSIGTGFDAATRAALWKDRASLVGRIVKFKFFPSGSKDRPRFPVWLGWRDPID